MYGYILNARPRFSIEETENVLKMLKHRHTVQLAAGILADADAVIPWRYVRELKNILHTEVIFFSLDREIKQRIITQQCNKRSRIEKKKIYGKEGAVQ